MEGKREGRVGDDGNMAEPGGHLARKALRRRKPQAAGVNARPTLWLGMGGDTEEAANRKVRRRADVSIGPYAGGAPRPSSTYHACRSRLCRPYALRCRAGVHARRGGLRRDDAVALCKRRTARPGRIEAARKGIGKVMCRTPQSADADSSPYRGAFQAAVSPKPPLQGEVGAPEGADGGAPGGKESLRDSSEPFGRPIPTCGSGSEFDRETG